MDPLVAAGFWNHQLQIRHFMPMLHLIWGTLFVKYWMAGLGWRLEYDGEGAGKISKLHSQHRIEQQQHPMQEPILYYK